MKKLSKEDEKITRVLSQEREYRAQSSGNKCNAPFVTPLLFELKNLLRIVIILLGFLSGYVIIQLLGLFS